MTLAGVVTTVANMFPGFEGFKPRAALIEGTDGNLYGTTAVGRALLHGHGLSNDSQRNDDGAPFVHRGGRRFTARVAPPGVRRQLLRHNVLRRIVDLGTVFRMTLDGTVTVLHSFTGLNEGASPYGGLVRGPDRNFYGTTRDGGALNFGTVLRVTTHGRVDEPATSSAATTGHSHSLHSCWARTERFMARRRSAARQVPARRSV